MQPPVDWLPPILMLLGGLVIGAVAAVLVARKSRGAEKRDKKSPAREELSDLQLELRDLEAKKEDLLKQLREMEDTSAKREPAQLAVERWETELLTAETLREIDRLTGRTSASRARVPSADKDSPETEAGPAGGIKGFVWGVASAAAIGALVVFVSQSASHRAEGGSVTGGQQMSGNPTAQPDPGLERAIAAVNAHPDNIDARVALAYEYLLREDFMKVFEETQTVLEKNPDEPRALTYQALVRLMMGQAETSTEMLERAVSIDPEFLESRVYLALTYSQSGRFDDAMAQIEEAKTRHPSEVAKLEPVVAELEARRASGVVTPPGQGENPHKSAVPAPPTSGSVKAPSPVPSGPGTVSGTISLADGVSVTPGSPIFVIVREIGAGGGPPVAVTRLIAGQFPTPFQVSAANSMMGDDLPDTMTIEVRVDLDGNAMTRDEGAPTGLAESVASGSSSVNIVLH